MKEVWWEGGLVSRRFGVKEVWCQGGLMSRMFGVKEVCVKEVMYAAAVGKHAALDPHQEPPP